MGDKRHINCPLVILLVLLWVPSVGQDETRGGESDEGTRYKVPDSAAKKPDPDRILLVPYEPSRYSNELEKEMKEETGLRLRQIRKRIRFGLDNMLLDRLQKDHEVVSYMRKNDPDRNFELKHIYRGLIYKYRPVPEEDIEALKEEEEEEKGFLKKLFGNPEKESKKDTGAGRNVMSEGQIKDRPDERVRFMDAMFRRKKLLDYLTRKYGVGYLLFINRLELRPRKNEPVKLAAGQHKNLIKVHYTLMDHKGHKVHGGAAFVTFPSEVKDLNGLIKGYFPKVADLVAEPLEKDKEGS